MVPLNWPADGVCSCPRGRACKATAKHPLVDRWTERASASPEVVRRWWERWPLANVGLATGQGSGVVALDVDPAHGGDDTLHELEASYSDLPATVEALTGGGGQHRLFVAPEQRVSTTAGRIGPGLDVRGEGGLVVLAPSLHANGSRYAWSVDAHPDDVALADMPGWLLALIQRRATPSRNERVDGPVPEGERHDSLVRMAGAMRRAGLTVEAVRQALAAQNRERCEPPLEGVEVERIASSAGRWAIGGPWSTDLAKFIADPRLNTRERMLLAVLALHANADGIAWPGYRRIEEVGGISRRQIATTLARLEATGRIEILQRSRGRGNRYRLTPTPPLA